MTQQYRYHVEKEYEEMRNLYLSMLDSGYWQEHSLEKKQFEERMRILFSKIVETE